MAERDVMIHLIIYIFTKPICCECVCEYNLGIHNLTLKKFICDCKDLNGYSF